MKIVTNVTELNDTDKGETALGSTQVFGLPASAPVSLVREVLTYALMAEKGYKTKAALVADGYEFAPEGPAFWDGEGDPEAASWCWDYQQDLGGYPVYVRQG